MRFTLVFSIAAALSMASGAARAGSDMVSIFPEDMPDAIVTFARIKTDPGVAHHDAAASRPALSDLKSRARHLRNHPPHSLRGASNLACLAVAIYHEARGEPDAGQYAVASVILQRAKVPGKWGDTPCEVVRPSQFSFMTSRHDFPPIRDGAAWAHAIDIAGRSLVAGPNPALEEADHYHTAAVSPSWDKSMQRVAVIGKHLFFRDPETEDAQNF